MSGVRRRQTAGASPESRKDTGEVANVSAGKVDARSVQFRMNLRPFIPRLKTLLYALCTVRIVGLALTYILG